MSLIEHELVVRAPIELVFDLSRSVELHVRSTSHTREVAVAGVTGGLLELGDEVTWRATHFGVRQNLTSRITRFERPTYFRDCQVKGAFARFDHDHYFEERGGDTLIVDRFDYDAPLGVLGRLAERLFLDRYLREFLGRRLTAIREAAEGGCGGENSAKRANGAGLR